MTGKRTRKCKRAVQHPTRHPGIIKTAYCFSSSQGDVPLDEKILQRPFVLRPLENHPFLTLKDFFETVEDFLLADRGRRLISILAELWQREVVPGEIDRMILRYEKYGTLYQIVSVEVLSGGLREKFASSVALSPEAREALGRETDLLNRLHRQYAYPYLPRIYVTDSVRVQRDDREEVFAIALAQWFEGFHEWHFSGDGNNAEGILIWDLVKGYRAATKEESYEIIRQASMILTLYYNTETHYRILPWHHGAGDFVVKSDQDGIQVRLVTVRGYEPPVFFFGDESTAPSNALLSFFLDMSIKMRLDKAEGMGDPVWANAAVVPAILEGLLEALRQKEEEGGSPRGTLDGIIKRFISITDEELYTRLAGQVEQYRELDPSDFSCMKSHLREHATDLYRAIKGYFTKR